MKTKNAPAISISKKVYTMATTDESGSSAEITMYGDIYEQQPTNWWGEPIEGQYMTAQLKFRTFSAESLKLQEPREHNIDLRAPQQVYDPIAGVYKTQSVKHVLVLVPKTLSNGNIAPASPTDGSGSYAVRRWVTYIDDAKVMELDPYNYICEVNGVDYLSDTRKALGKS